MHELESYRDIPIFITDEGKFQAEVNGETRKRSSLASLKKYIDENSANVDAFVLQHNGPRRVTIAGADRRNKIREAFRTVDGAVVGGYSSEYVYQFDQELFNWFTDWQTRKNALEEERSKVIQENRDKRLRHSDL